MYTIYTLPTCPHCHEAVEFMDKQKIPYELINTGVKEGMAKFREFYAKNKERISRDGNGAIDLPIIVYQNNGDMMIHQGSKGLEGFFKQEIK